MNKVYEAPAAQPILFRPVEELSATWLELEQGVGSGTPQIGAVASKEDIFISF